MFWEVIWNCLHWKVEQVKTEFKKDDDTKTEDCVVEVNHIDIKNEVKSPKVGEEQYLRILF